MKKILFIIMICIGVFVGGFVYFKHYAIKNSESTLSLLDGGTTIEKNTDNHKIINWNRAIIGNDGKTYYYKKRAEYRYPISEKTIEELWELEKNSDSYDDYIVKE